MMPLVMKLSSGFLDNGKMHLKHVQKPTVLTRRALLAAIIAGVVALPVSAVQARRGRGRGGRRDRNRDDDYREGGDDDHNRAWKALESGKVKPLSELVEEAKKIVPGDITKVEFEYKGERPVYLLTILSKSGIYFDFVIDASSGAILSMRKK